MSEKNFLPTIELLHPGRFARNTLHSDDKWTLLLFFSGSGRLQAQRVMPFTAGDIILAQPGCDLSFVGEEDGDTSAALIQYPVHYSPAAQLQEPLSGWYTAMCDAAAPALMLQPDRRGRNAVQALFRTVYTEYAAAALGTAALLQMQLLVLLGWLARYHHLQQPVNAQRMPRGTDLVERVKRMLADEYAEPLTLAQVATRCYVSPEYLSGLFHKKTGLPFNRYLNLTRVSRACSLLLDTDELAVDIAEATGFSSAPHFNATFRKLTGFTPLEYRKLFKKSSLSDENALAETAAP